MSKIVQHMSRSEKNKVVNALETICEGKWAETGPEIKKQMYTLSYYLRTVVESFAAVQDEFTEVKKELNELKKMRVEVGQIRDKMTKVGDQMDKLETKIDEKHNNMEGLVTTTMEALKNVEVKLKKDDVERLKEKEARDKDRKEREDEKIAYQRACVAPCLIIYGFKVVDGENNDSLFKEVKRFFKETLGLNDEVSVHQVMRFGRPAGNASTTASTTASARPPLVRVVLNQPSMKGILFKSLIRLKNKEEYKGLSIQNEVAKIEMPAHKLAVQRAIAIRNDTGNKVRVTVGRGGITLKVLFEGKWISEKEFHEKQDKKDTD